MWIPVDQGFVYLGNLIKEFRGEEFRIVISLFLLILFWNKNRPWINVASNEAHHFDMIKSSAGIIWVTKVIVHFHWYPHTLQRIISLFRYPSHVLSIPGSQFGKCGLSYLSLVHVLVIPRDHVVRVTFAMVWEYKLFLQTLKKVFIEYTQLLDITNFTLEQNMKMKYFRFVILQFKCEYKRFL